MKVPNKYRETRGVMWSNESFENKFSVIDDFLFSNRLNN